MERPIAKVAMSESFCSSEATNSPDSSPFLNSPWPMPVFKESRRGYQDIAVSRYYFVLIYLFAVVKALEVIVTLLDALVGLVSKGIALAELLPCRVASAAS